MSGGPLSPIPLRIMTTQTLLIIEAGIANQRLVRIVARGAGKPRIFRPLPTAALLQAIRLKTNAAETTRTWIQHDIHQCPVAGSTEINRARRREMGWIENGPSRFVCQMTVGGVNVVNARSMAGLTMDSRDGLFEVKFALRRPRGSVACETSGGFSN